MSSILLFRNNTGINMRKNLYREIKKYLCFTNKYNIQRKDQTRKKQGSLWCIRISIQKIIIF